jgi:hypothetical protein
MPDRQETRRLVGVIADKIADGTLVQAGLYSRADLAAFVREASASMANMDSVTQLRHLDEWRPTDGPALWWRLPLGRPPHLGAPNDSDFPSDVMHWTRIPTPRL